MTAPSSLGQYADTQKPSERAALLLQHIFEHNSSTDAVPFLLQSLLDSFDDKAEETLAVVAALQHYASYRVNLGLPVKLDLSLECLSSYLFDVHGAELEEKKYLRIVERMAILDLSTGGSPFVIGKLQETVRDYPVLAGRLLRVYLNFIDHNRLLKLPRKLIKTFSNDFRKNLLHVDNGHHYLFNCRSAIEFIKNYDEKQDLIYSIFILEDTLDPNVIIDEIYQDFLNHSFSKEYLQENWKILLAIRFLCTNGGNAPSDLFSVLADFCKHLINSEPLPDMPKAIFRKLDDLYGYYLVRSCHTRHATEMDAYFDRDEARKTELSPETLIRLHYLFGKFQALRDLIGSWREKNRGSHGQRRMEYLRLERRDVGRWRFRAVVDGYLAKLAQAPTPRGVVFLADGGQESVFALAAPFVAALRESGYAVLSLNHSGISFQSCGIAGLDALHGSVPHSSLIDSIRCDLTGQIELDLAGKRAIYRGINYFEGLREIITVVFRQTKIDKSDERLRKFCLRQINRMAFHLQFAERCEAIGKSGCQVPVFVLGSLMTCLPNSVFRDYRNDAGGSPFEPVFYSTAYDHYGDKSEFPRVRRVRCLNTARNPLVRAPFIPLPAEFEAWYAQSRWPREPMPKQRNLGAARWTKPVETAVSKLRHRYKHLVLLVGKLTFDQGVPFDGGPAHQDMTDWLNHSIEAVRGSDTCLIIKPHPYELRGAISWNSNERFVDLIADPGRGNLHILRPDELSISDSLGIIDAATAWSGTAPVEYAAAGVPVVMCGWFGRHDYPMLLSYPESREHYAAMLRDPQGLISLSEEARRRANAYLDFIKSGDFGAPFTYASLSATNADLGPPAVLNLDGLLSGPAMRAMVKEHF